MGFIYIIWSIDYGVGVYRIVKSNGNTNLPPNIELIRKYSYVNENLAEIYLRNVLNKFLHNREFYKCPQEWLELACQYVQKIVNRDEEIMDLDLPWV